MTLHIPELIKTYPGADAFGLNTRELRLSDEGFTCVVGKNGSGKSTFGETLASTEEQNGRGRWYFLPQYLERFLFAENLVDQLHNLLAQEIDTELLKTLLTDMGFANPQDMLDFPFLLLSGGERRRMALVCVLYLQPSQLILDEPDIGVTVKENMVLLSKIDNLQAMNASIILISHNYEFVRHSTNLICLENGRIGHAGKTEDLFSDPDFDLKEYGVRFETNNG